MKLGELDVNQLSKDGLDWYVRYLTAFDAQDAEAYAAFLAQDCVMQLGNNLPVYSVAAIMTVVGRIWSRYRSLEHEILNLYGSDRRFSAELLWHFVRLDGQRIIIPAAAVFDRNEQGLAQTVRFYSNVAPVFESANLADDV